MAWVHKKNFTILQALDEGLNQEEYMEIDDMIALPVAMLNQKGYVTTESCAGHPFPHVHLLDTRIDTDIAVDFDDLAQSLKTEETGETVPFEFHTYAGRRAYVDFQDPLPDDMEIPEGWVYDYEDQRLMAHFTKKTDPYAFFSNQLKKMKALMDWVNTL